MAARALGLAGRSLLSPAQQTATAARALELAGRALLRPLSQRMLSSDKSPFQDFTNAGDPMSGFSMQGQNQTDGGFPRSFAENGFTGRGSGMGGNGSIANGPLQDSTSASGPMSGFSMQGRNQSDGGFLRSFTENGFAGSGGRMDGNGSIATAPLQDFASASGPMRGFSMQGRNQTDGGFSFTENGFTGRGGRMGGNGSIATGGGRPGRFNTEMLRPAGAPRVKRDVLHITLKGKKTFVTVTDVKGNRKAGASAGCLEDRKGRSRLARYAGEATGEHMGRVASKIGLKSVVVKVKGYSFFRKKKKVIMGFADGFRGERVRTPSPIMYVHDMTQLAHNGCRLPKKVRK